MRHAATAALIVVASCLGCLEVFESVASLRTNRAILLISLSDGLALGVWPTDHEVIFMLLVHR